MYPEEASKSSSGSKAASTNTSTSNEKTKDSESKEAMNESNAKEAQQEETEKAPKKVQKKKNRCWNCRKKVTLAGQFECKCGYVFCSLHRYPDAHECDFDWKKQHQDKLAQDNKTVAPSKLDKI
jgi:predicted nucleic acid binding AN1-type Zn finger protein